MSKSKGTHPPVTFAAQAAARPNPILWGYGFGAALILMGFLVLSIALGSALRSATHGVHRVTMPGRQALTLKEGLYIGLLPAGKDAPAPGDVRVLLTDESGAPIPQTPIPPELSQANRKVGTTLFQAEVPYDGRYGVESRLPDGAAPAQLLLVHESLNRNPSDILVGVILLVVLGGFGAYILIITYRRGAAAAPRS
jgi:hypothetical protein